MSRRFLVPRGPAYLDFTRLFTSLIGFSGGIILAEFWRPSLLFGIGMIIVGVFALWRPKTRLVGLLVLSIIIGVLRWHGWTATTAHSLETLAGSQQTITGIVADLPTMQFDRQEIELANVRTDGQLLKGKVSVRLPSYPIVHIGQRLTMSCKFTLFQPRSKIRQRLHDIRGYCDTGKVLKTEQAKADWRITLSRIKAWAITRISEMFPEPQSSLLIGILLGRQVPMAPDLEESFRATGTTHIIALSGFNVTIIITALSALVDRLIGRRWSWMVILLFVGGFVIMTGAAASVTRAGLMAGVVIMALRMGRPVAMVRLLAYALLLMTWHNPLILVHDLGFQLSFLATVGLVYVSPGIQAWLRFVPDRLSIRSNLGTTLGAILATEPLLLWHFARASLVAPLTNILILPLIPLAMTAGFVSLLIPPLWPAADAMLRLVIGIILWTGAMPGATSSVSGWALPLTATAATTIVVLAIKRTHALQDRLT